MQNRCGRSVCDEQSSSWQQQAFRFQVLFDFMDLWTSCVASFSKATFLFYAHMTVDFFNAVY
jgi:hypothetical protein